MLKPTIPQFIAGLRAACDRGTAVEVAAELPQDEGPGTTFKVSILDVADDGRVVLEMPREPEASAELRRGRHALVLMAEGVGRVIGACRIEAVEYYQLNAQRRVRALRLGRPTRVESAQRRRFFRVQAAGTANQPVLLRPATPQAGGAAPLLKARLHNISGGGFGLVMDRSTRLGNTLRAARDFQASLPLPGGDPLTVHCRLVHLQPMAGDTIYLGFQLDHRNAAEQRTVEDRIVRATTEMQRLQLRRQRGA